MSQHDPATSATPAYRPDQPGPAATPGEPASPEQLAPPEPPAPAGRWLTPLVVAAGGVVGVGAAAVLVGVVLAVVAEDPPATGDCLPEEAVTDALSVVDCADPVAYWRVVGTDGDWAYAEFDRAGSDEVCTGHPETRQALWFSDARRVDDDTDGQVLCLVTVGDGR